MGVCPNSNQFGGTEPLGPHDLLWGYTGLAIPEVRGVFSSPDRGELQTPHPCLLCLRPSQQQPQVQLSPPVIYFKAQVCTPLLPRLALGTQEC